MADVTITSLSDLAPSSDTYIPLSNGTTTGRALTNNLPGLTPVGGIIMWSGSIAAIPTGWALCNGSNGTPDLRNRFIVGATVDNAGIANTNITGSNTQTGGSKDAIVVDHTHTASDSGHTHGLQLLGQAGVFNRGTQYNVAVFGGTGATTNASSANITVAAAGQSGTNANLPPYYALAYIMRTS
jgi:microcystin-dependent protein